jgi:hypothetical protein
MTTHHVHLPVGGVAVTITLCPALRPTGFSSRLFLVLSLAATLPFARCSLAAFISFGAKVRTCFIWVGTRPLARLTDNFPVGTTHGIVKVGTDWSKDSRNENSGAVLCRVKLTNQ